MKWVEDMWLRKRIWEIVEVAKPSDKASKFFDIFILFLIALNVACVIVGSVQSVQEKFGMFLCGFEIFSVLMFTVEYAMRIWSCVTDPSYSKPVFGRLRFACRPMPIIDLLAILPFYLPFLGVDLRSLRVLRLFRLLRVAKVGRYYASLGLIKNVINSKKEELLLTTFVMAMLLILSSSLMYYCENTAQPNAFPNIPATMWWAVATLTTVGYGDIYPVTIAGKILGSIIAILGIGMFALPTGILGAGFVEEVQRQKSAPTLCPHCGTEI